MYVKQFFKNVTKIAQTSNITFRHYNFYMHNHIKPSCFDKNQILSVPFNEDGYKRVTLQKNEYLELVYFVWKPYGYISPHTHTQGGCFMKILDGCLEESLFTNETQLIQKKKYFKNDIAFIRGKEALHSLYNMSDYNSESLHLYRL